jgi:hypothetical protein
MIDRKYKEGKSPECNQRKKQRLASYELPVFFLKDRG